MAFEHTFDKIFVFTCEQAVDRQEYIREQFENHNIDGKYWEFQINIDYRKITKRRRKILYDTGIIDDRKYSDRYEKVKSCEISAGLGLMQMIKKWIQRDYNTVLFMQDDILLNENFREQFFEMKEYFPKHWDSLHFYSHSYHGCGNERDLNRQNYNKFFKLGYNEGHGSNVMCAWRKSTFPLLLSRCIPVTTAIDGTFNMTTMEEYRGKFNGFISKEFLCKPNPKFQCIYSKYGSDVDN